MFGVSKFSYWSIRESYSSSARCVNVFKDRSICSERRMFNADLDAWQLSVTTSLLTKHALEKFRAQRVILIGPLKQLKPLL